MFARPRDVARLGLMASAAIVLFAFESLVPKPLPWMKLGLGNLPVLVALVSFGGGPALAVSAIKLVAGGLLSGGLPVQPLSLAVELAWQVGWPWLRSAA